jgi:hypothetical protein
MSRLSQSISSTSFVIAQLLILLIGLGAVGGLYYYLNVRHTSTLPNQFSKITPITDKPATFTLDLTTPQDDLLVFDNTLPISGTTSPNLNVLVSSQNNDLIAQSNKSGTFTVTFPLSEGINDLTIIAFDKNGEQRQATRTVYYSKEKLQ